MKAKPMFKVRIVLVVVAIALTIVIFTLPRVVVQNEADNGPIAESPSSQENILPIVEWPEDKIARKTFLTESFRNNTNNEKSTIFADSLATMYAEMGVYDSAAWYSAWIADNTNSSSAVLKAGNMYYEAFETAHSKNQANLFGEKSRHYLELYLQDTPNDADAKSKVAMTYVASEDAMKGINMLMDVVGENPEHESALYNLGVLSMQISQYQKAVERFTKLVEVNPTNVNGHFYLGICYMELKKNADAKAHFQKAKDLSADQEIHAAVDNYLEQIK